MNTVPGGQAPAPAVLPTPESLPFWEACKERRLVLPFCPSCDRPFFYPRACCPACGGRSTGWIPATGSGTLHSFCVQYQTSVPGYRDAVPFVTALVDLDEGPRIMSLLVGAGTDPQAIRIGARLRVVFLDSEGSDGGWLLPAFEPDPDAPASGPTRAATSGKEGSNVD